jgi:hypothetical protein
MPTSPSKQALQLAKLNRSSISTNTVISFLIELFRRLNALSTPFCVPNAVHADFIVQPSPASRKIQSFLDFDEYCYFVPDWDISLFWRSFHSILHAKSSSSRIQRRNMTSNSQNSIFPRFQRKLLFRSWLRYFVVLSLFPLHFTRQKQIMPNSALKQAQQLAKLNLSSISTKTVISFLIEIFRRLNALPTPFCAPNAVHAGFIVETSPASRKIQSFLDFDENCYFVPDWDISLFWRSFHSILHAKSSSSRIQRRNMTSNSQNSIFPRFQRKLLFRSWLRYFVVLSLFPLHFTRQKQIMPNSALKQAQQLAKLNLSSISTKTVISFLIEIFRRLNALPTPFCAPNAVYADFIVKTSPASRKIKSFLDFDEYCYFVPDWDISLFWSSFHSILPANSSSCRNQRRNKPSITQNSIFPRL